MRGVALNLMARILSRVKEHPGAVWTPVDFLDLGSRASVDKALQRLARAGELRRIDRGLYDRPRVSTLTGQETVPDHRIIIEAIARRDQTRMLLDGMTAANDLGLTTAVPVHVVVLTGARLRPLKVGNLEITFKTVAPSRLYWAGRPAMRIIQALHWLHDMLPVDRDRIAARLAAVVSDPLHGPTVRDDLKDGFHTLPIWMQSIVRDLLEGSSREKPGKAPRARRVR